MICQQYISKVKGASGPPCLPASTGVPRPWDRHSFQAPTLSALPLGGHMEPWFRASLSGFEPEFFHFLDLGQCFPLCAPQFPHLLMGMITFSTLHR